jgi:hypothetical protein
VEGDHRDVRRREGVAPPNLRERERERENLWPSDLGVSAMSSCGGGGPRPRCELGEATPPWRFACRRNPAPPSRSTPVGERRGDCWVAARERSYPPQTQARYHHLSMRNMVPTLTSRKRRGLSLNGRC